MQNPSEQECRDFVASYLEQFVIDRQRDYDPSRKIPRNLLRLFATSAHQEIQQCTQGYNGWYAADWKLVSAVYPHVTIIVGKTPWGAWREEMTFQLTLEHGRLALLPSFIPDEGYGSYFQAWQSKKTISKEQVTFYMLHDDEDELCEQRPNIAAVGLDSIFLPDYIPSVCEADDFQHDCHQGLETSNEKQQEDLRKLIDFVEQHKFDFPWVGYQSEERKE